MEQKHTDIFRKVTAADSDLHLTEECCEEIWELAGSLSLMDVNIITQFGTDVQKKLAEISGMMVGSLRTSFAPEVGHKLAELSTVLEAIDSKTGSDERELSDYADDDRKPLGLFVRSDLPGKRAKLERALRKVEDTSKELERYQIELTKELAVLDRMLDVSSIYVTELNKYIAASDLLIRTIGTEDCPASSLGHSELGTIKKILTERVSELRLTRSVSVRQVPLLTKVMEDSATLTEKVQSTLYNTIPLWHDQIILSLESDLSSRAFHSAAKVTERTNSLLLDRIREIIGIRDADSHLLDRAEE